MFAGMVKVLDYSPLQQGLRLFYLYDYKDIHNVLDYSPLQQGLRQINDTLT